MSRCSVYVIGTIADGRVTGPVKVGIARNPGARLLELQTGNPRQLHLICNFSMGTRKLARGIEYGFHVAHEDERLRGEWFDVTPAHAKHCVGVVALMDGGMEL